MIELDVEAKRAKPQVVDANKTRYLILGDFGGRGTEPLTVDRDNLDDVLSRLDVSLAGLRVREIEDFHPDRLYQRIESFQEQDAGKAADAPAREPSTPKANLQEILKPSGLLDQILEGGDPFQQYLRDLARAHSAPTKKDNSARDKDLSDRMRALLHHPRFQEIESAWRGLDFVVSNLDEEFAAIHMVQLSRADLERDLLEAKDLRSTRTYQLFTSRPWKGVVGLFSFGATPADAELLATIALIAAHAKTLFVAEGSVSAGSHWDELRAIPEARALGLALPRFLLRLPYGAKTSRIESFPFEEMYGHPAHADYLWGNAALAVLTIATRAAGEDDALDLTGLPLHTYQQDGEWVSTPCAEMYLTESQVSGLMEQGLMPLVSFRDTDKVRVAGLRAINGASLPLAI